MPLARLPGLLSLALLFWGWHATLLVPALALAGLFELAQRSRWQWQFERSELHRIADLSTLLLVGAAIYLYLNGAATRLVFTLLEWGPLILAPLLFAQFLAGLPALPLSTLFYSLRRRGDDGRRLDLYLPYIALCLLAASVSAAQGLAYWVGAVLLLGWILWGLGGLARHRRTALPLLCLAAALGYLGQLGIVRLHAHLEEAVVAWLSDYFTSSMDPYHSTTRIGEVGELKLSGAIRYRVRGEGDLAAQGLLLRRSSYTLYRDGNWVADGPQFNLLIPYGDGMSWRVEREPPPVVADHNLVITARMGSDRVLLPAPSGAQTLRNLPVGVLEHNRLGALRAEQGPALIDYGVSYTPRTAYASPPQASDLDRPEVLQPTLERFVREQQLAGLTPVQQATRIAFLFATDYHYTLDLQTPEGREPLAYFLFERRAGHCEYYATATTLLLRQLGIPARYAVGYAVQEESALEGSYIVRARHAHAWSEYWAEGAWHTLDTTPSVWLDYEASRDPWLQPLWDLFSYLGERFTRFGQSSGEEGGRSAWLWWLLPLGLLLAWRLLRQRRAQRDVTTASGVSPGAESMALLTPVIEQLQADGLVRLPGETLGRWWARIEREQPGYYGLEGLRSLLPLHYRQRFLPERLELDQLREGQARVAEWCAGRRARYSEAENAQVKPSGVA